MKRLAAVIAMICAFSVINLAPAQAGSFCNNGSYSMNSGRGTCSYNGGVDRNFPSYSDPGSSSYNRNNGFGSYGSTSRNPLGYGSSLNDPYSSFGSTSKKKSRW
jgi:hypothetical protein